MVRSPSHETPMPMTPRGNGLRRVPSRSTALLVFLSQPCGGHLRPTFSLEHTRGLRRHECRSGESCLTGAAG